MQTMFQEQKLGRCEFLDLITRNKPVLRAGLYDFSA